MRLPLILRTFIGVVLSDFLNTKGQSRVIVIVPLCFQGLKRIAFL